MSSNLEKYRLTVVLGPTASGKTRYAVRLAGEAGAEIISADSRQIYRGMDIGTGKDLGEYVYEGRPVPYHLIDIVDAGVRYDIFLPSNPALRAELEQYSDEYLIDMLKSLTVPHNTTDYDTRKRLIRAIEIAVYQKEHPEDAGVFSGDNAPLARFAPEEVHYIGLSVSREERNARIDRRLDARLKEGMIDEVRRLLESGLSPDDLIYYGLEYKFVTLYLTGQMSYDEMHAKLAVAIHQFAKRQMTWFRGMERRGIHIDWVTV